MIFRRLAEEYGFTRDDVMRMTWSETRMYLTDENWLSNKPKMESQPFLEMFRLYTKKRIQGLADSVIHRVRGS